VKAALVTGLVAAIPFSVGVVAHEHHAMTDMPEHTRLGAVSFANSCKAQVQDDFNRATALLHSFWLDAAERTFQKVIAADPDCAMAYWGVAFAGLHLFTGPPSQAEVAAGNAVLAKSETARERSPREAGYVHALRAFYDNYKPEQHLERTKAFAAAMGALTAAHPDDLEAKVFYGLALLAAHPPDDLALTNPKKAVALLNPLLRKYPEHPGIAHYIIHACDTPEMAKDGLEAARRYASIAPAAPHALHMPSHIFVRLGLWQDVVNSNLASKAASESKQVRVGAENRLHAMEFLQYAYLQVGQYEEANQIAEEARTVNAADVNPAYPNYYNLVAARLQASLAIETQDWKRAAHLQPIAGAATYVQGLALLANTIAAGHLRDRRAGSEAAQAFDALVAQEPFVRSGDGVDTLRGEIRAWASFSAGDSDAAIRLLRPIADRQGKVGKSELELPAGEMLAEMLLLDGQAAAALQQYQASLLSDPNRFSALIGAGQAAEEVGRDSLAVGFYRTLLESCPRPSGMALNRLAHARTVVRAAS
jgi:tetratricopeptide (TPR) repeat protein